MRLIATAYFAAALTMVGLDLCWLTLTGPYYRRMLGPLLADTTNWAAAIAFYLIYLAGVLCFAVWPAFEAGTWRSAAMRGAAFGFVAYATYDLTSMATLKIWSLRITLLDMGWGTLLTAVTASVGAAIVLALEK